MASPDGSSQKIVQTPWFAPPSLVVAARYRRRPGQLPITEKGRWQEPPAISLSLIARAGDAQSKLLQFDGSACCFQVSFSFVSGFFRNAFSNNLRSGINLFLGFFQAQAGQFTNSLDHVYFLVASGNQNNVELGLFFNNGSGSSWAGCGNSSGNTEGFFHCFDQLNNFQNGFLADCFDDLLVSQRHDLNPVLG
ncbi:conserved protein of unknown function [Pseudomonas sp. JV241A]|nr:conserved protein of unknown function [Pseudomonas sp. JV241A]